MRFLIIGAGALGGYFGGALVKGGADVTFLVRPRRAAQLTERGLTIRTGEDVFTMPVKSVQAGAAGGPYDVVFLACKAYDLETAIDDFGPALSPDGSVLPVLNGINHIAMLRDRLGSDRVLGGVVIFLVTVTPDGDIIVSRHAIGQTSFGELTGERSARCEAIQAALAAGGVESTVSDNIVGEMWAKFCGMATNATISTLMRARAGAIAAAPSAAQFVAAVFDECAQVTTAEGYPPAAWIKPVIERMYGEIGSDYGPSTLHDMENGQRTEGDHIIGDLVRRANRLGIEVPILRAALCNLEVYEARRIVRADGAEIGEEVMPVTLDPGQIAPDASIWPRG
jgi:2-dehydropantoate 2-reductase